MKVLLVFLLTFLLVACSKETSEVTSEYILPQGMEHCKVFNMRPGNGGNSLVGIHCPNEIVSITRSSGKSTESSESTESSVVADIPAPPASSGRAEPALIINGKVYVERK